MPPGAALHPRPGQPGPDPAGCEAGQVPAEPRGAAAARGAGGGEGGGRQGRPGTLAETAAGSDRGKRGEGGKRVSGEIKF